MIDIEENVRIRSGDPSGKFSLKAKVLDRVSITLPQMVLVWNSKSPPRVKSSCWSVVKGKV